MRIAPLGGLGASVCFPITTTGEGALLSRLGSKPPIAQPWGYQFDDAWGWLDRNGTLLRDISVAAAGTSLPMAHTLVTIRLINCNPDFVATHCYGAAELTASWPNGARRTASLGDAAPGWELASFSAALLPESLRGVAVVVEELETPINVGVSSWRSRIRVFDEDGTECVRPWVAESGISGTAPAVSAAVDDFQRVLVLFEWHFPFRQAARWFSLDGVPITDVFPVRIDIPSCDPSCSFTGGQPFLTPLIGGGIVYQQGLQYLTVFPSGEPRYGPAPPWLKRMNGKNLHRVRAGAGYGFVRLTQVLKDDCANAIEFVSPEGEDCGALRVDTTTQCPGGAEVGRDGTAFVWAKSYSSDPCHFSVWDRLLQ